MLLHSLQAQLGYVFNNIALLRQALTHRSANALHNERLEFLGDALLNFIIGKVLYQRFPYATEGQLSQMRSTLVCRQTLALLAKNLGIAQVLILGKGVVKSGTLPDTLISNALEALIAAIYLDSQQNDTAEQLVINWYQGQLATIAPGYRQKDPKSCLQEYLQGLHEKRPVYTVTAVKGRDHEQQFVVQCKIVAANGKFIGMGPSRRRAEQAAAAKAICALNLPWT